VLTSAVTWRRVRVTFPFKACIALNIKRLVEALLYSLTLPFPGNIITSEHSSRGCAEVRALQRMARVVLSRFLYSLLREFRLWRWQCGLEIRLCLSLPTVESAFNLMDEHVAAPAMLNGTTDIPLALLGRFYEVQNTEIVSPGNLTNNLLDKWLFRPRRCKCTHVKQIGS
jgi:hypothetical protein